MNSPRRTDFFPREGRVQGFRGSGVRGGRGVTLLELLVVLMILSLILTAAVKTWDVTLERGRWESTTRKLNQLVTAVTGEPNYVVAGHRADFGFVGDVGRLPFSLEELVSFAVTPPESSRWRGPYLRSTFSESPEGFRIDGWGDTIIYNRESLFVRSLGGRGMADKTRWQTALLSYDNRALTENEVTGQVVDVRGLPATDTVLTSIMVTLSYPREGKLVSEERTGSELRNGEFRFWPVPQGIHRLHVKYMKYAPADSVETDVDVIVYPRIGARDVRARLDVDWNREP